MERRSLLKALLLAPLAKFLPKTKTEAKTLTKEEPLDTQPGFEVLETLEVSEGDTLIWTYRTLSSTASSMNLYIYDGKGNWHLDPHDEPITTIR